MCLCGPQSQSGCSQIEKAHTSDHKPTPVVEFVASHFTGTGNPIHLQNKMLLEFHTKIKAPFNVIISTCEGIAQRSSDFHFVIFPCGRDPTSQ
jgi:hypothetical protein